MTLFDKCPGAANIRSATIILKKCPNCGEKVELFSDEMQVKCDNCGFTVYNNIESCVQWCKYARACVGDELYKKLKKKE